MDFSIISDSDKGIKLPWIGNEKDDLYKEHGYHTGIDIYANNVYSFCSGVVTSIGKDDNYYAVTVQYNPGISVRYLHLKSVCVKAGKAVQERFHIGVADKYVHFEYVTKKQGASKWSVRVGTETYYKQNPNEIIKKNNVSDKTDYSDLRPTKDMLTEFSNGKGGK